MLLTSSFVNGAVSGSVIFSGFRGVVGFAGIQPLSCTNRKNARKASSFFRAAIFLFGQDARNRRTASTIESTSHADPRSNRAVSPYPQHRRSSGHPREAKYRNTYSKWVTASADRPPIPSALAAVKGQARYAA